MSALIRDLHLSVFLRPSLFTWPHSSLLESSCQSKGRGFPGRHHHQSTPLLNRPQKITPAFQPRQQPPLGFGQVSACSHIHVLHKRMYTWVSQHTQLFKAVKICWLQRKCSRHLAPSIEQNIEYKHLYGQREFMFMKDCKIYLIFKRKQIAGKKSTKAPPLFFHWQQQCFGQGVPLNTHGSVRLWEVPFFYIVKSLYPTSALSLACEEACKLYQKVQVLKWLGLHFVHLNDKRHIWIAIISFL